MKIGIVKEIKKNEFRVAATPSSVEELVRHGHCVFVESGAGEGSDFADSEYLRAGAQIECDAKKIWQSVDLIYKVKEIFPSEYQYLRDTLTIFTYIHSNSHFDQTIALLKNGCTSIAYEDVSDHNGDWPLLSPMSEIAGKGGFLAALHFAQTINGGQGKLLANACGVSASTITIIGCGHSGTGACEIASSLGNRVHMLDIDLSKMEYLKQRMPENVDFLYCNRNNLLSCIIESDVIMNCVLWPKTRTDHLLYRKDLHLLKKNTMIIDVACDEGGAVETCHCTSHDDPTYFEEGILHYCVDNIPSAFANTSSIALSNATLPFALEIADKGVFDALKANKHLRRGLTTYHGRLTLLETALKLNLQSYYSPAEEMLGIQN